MAEFWIFVNNNSLGLGVCFVILIWSLPDILRAIRR